MVSGRKTALHLHGAYSADTSPDGLEKVLYNVDKFVQAVSWTSSCTSMQYTK
jgi:hypothetical protein